MFIGLAALLISGVFQVNVAGSEQVLMVSNSERQGHRYSETYQKSVTITVDPAVVMFNKLLEIFQNKYGLRFVDAEGEAYWVLVQIHNDVALGKLDPKRMLDDEVLNHYAKEAYTKRIMQEIFPKVEKILREEYKLSPLRVRAVIYEILGEIQRNIELGELDPKLVKMDLFFYPILKYHVDKAYWQLKERGR